MHSLSQKTYVLSVEKLDIYKHGTLTWGRTVIVPSMLKKEGKVKNIRRDGELIEGVGFE